MIALRKSERPLMTRWPDLSTDEQLKLREAYGRDPDCQTGTCSMDAKIAQFANWLAVREIEFTADDLKR